MKDFEVFAIIVSGLSLCASVGVSTMYSCLHSKITTHTVAWMKDQEEINRILRERIERLEGLVNLAPSVRREGR